MGIRIAVVDDNAAVRQSIRGSSRTRRTSSSSVRPRRCGDAQLLVEHVRPDVVVLDVRLPDGDGVDLCQTIRSHYPGTACVMLTAYSDDEALIAALLAGAAGYFLKQIRGGDLVSCIRTVSAGSQFLDSSLMGRCLASLGSGSEYGFEPRSWRLCGACSRDCRRARSRRTCRSPSRPSRPAGRAVSTRCASTACAERLAPAAGRRQMVRLNSVW